MAAEKDEMIGQKIGNYEISELLGKGGMGSVYLARHPRIERQVAIKILAPYVVQQPMAAKRFEAEARLISKIDHPNIIEIYDFGTLDNGSLYYVMELLKGQELRQVMRKNKKMPAQVVQSYLEQICAALQAAHDLGVIHRDLKPENIFILGREPMTLKVLDFGVAKLLESNQDIDLTAAGVVVGTPLFVAPEQAAGQPNLVSNRTDIYSLGVLLYWMLGGRPPFLADGPGMLMAMHIKDSAKPIQQRAPTVPDGVAAIVHQCLEKKPEDRPASAAEVYEAFETALDAAAPAGEASAAVSVSGDDHPVVSGETPMPISITSEGGRQVAVTGDGVVLGNVTTVTGANGEVTTLVVQQNKSKVWLWAGLAMALTGGLLVTVFYFTNSNNKPPAAAPAAVAVKSPATPAPPVKVEQRTIQVNVAGGMAVCRFKDGGRVVRQLPAPCSHQAPVGHALQLEVVAAGHQAYGFAWQAQKNVTLDLALDEAGKRIVTSASLAASLAARARQETASEAQKERKRKSRRRARKLKKKKFTPVGEGTMEVD